MEVLIVLSPPPHFDVQGSGGGPWSLGSGEQQNIQCQEHLGERCEAGLTWQAVGVDTDNLPTGGLSSPFEHVDSALTPGGGRSAS